MDAQALKDRLTAELTAVFGPPRQHREFSAWWLDPDGSLDVRVYTHCRRGNVCDLWLADPVAHLNPRVLFSVRRPADIPAAIGALRGYLRGHPECRHRAAMGTAPSWWSRLIGRAPPEPS